MSERDDGRVEYRLSTTGRLVNATPERIEDLMRLRAEREKLSRPAPVQSFDAVLKGQQGGDAAAAAAPRPTADAGPPPKAPPRPGARRRTIIKG